MDGEGAVRPELWLSLLGRRMRADLYAGGLPVLGK